MIEIVKYICDSIVDITLIICIAIGLIKIVMLCIKECHEKKVLFDERDRKTKWEENRLKRDTALSGKESEIAFLQGELKRQQTETENIKKKIILIHLLYNKLGKTPLEDLEKKMEEMEKFCETIEKSMNIK